MSELLKRALRVVELAQPDSPEGCVSGYWVPEEPMHMLAAECGRVANREDRAAEKDAAVSGFTPGPWRILDVDPIAVVADAGDAGGWQSITNVPAPRSNESAMADARLIAAAPEMYELLRASYQQRGWTGEQIMAVRALLSRIDGEG